MNHENIERVVYEGGATFVPVCINCGRFVKPDKTISVNEEVGFIKPQPNADCAKCGRTKMIFEGFC